VPSEAKALKPDGILECESCGPTPGRAPDEMRCSCGNLLARLVADGVELKCRRCKRTLVLPLGSNAAPEVNNRRA